MGTRFDPADWLARVLPKNFEKSGLLSENLSIKQRYLKALVRATSLSGKEITEEVYKMVDFYEKKEAELKAAGVRAYKQEALNDQALLKQRIKNMLVYTEVQKQRHENKGKMYRWLPSSSDTPDPEHALLYGQLFREGKGDRHGNMPGERYGCQCGIEWLEDDAAFKEFAGHKHTGYKGQKAVDKMLKERNGYIPNAFKTKDGDYISLIWGNEHIGFDHLIRGRSKQFDIEEFLKDFSFIIKNGKKIPNKYSDTRFDLWNKKKKKLVVIETIFGQGKKINFPVTIVRQKNTPKR